MVPSARRPLRVRHWDRYAQMSKNQKNTSPFADSKGPMPTNPTPIATVGRYQTRPNATKRYAQHNTLI